MTREELYALMPILRPPSRPAPDLGFAALARELAKDPAGVRRLAAQQRADRGTAALARIIDRNPARFVRMARQVMTRGRPGKGRP